MWSGGNLPLVSTTATTATTGKGGGGGGDYGPKPVNDQVNKILAVFALVLGLVVFLITLLVELTKCCYTKWWVLLFWGSAAPSRLSSRFTSSLNAIWPSPFAL